MCFLVSCGSMLNTEDVNKDPYVPENLPNEHRDLMCCFKVSQKVYKLENELDGFSKFSNASMWALISLCG